MKGSSYRKNVCRDLKIRVRRIEVGVLCGARWETAALCLNV